MKDVLLLSFCALFCAGAAFGQPTAGGIGLFVDPSYVDCDFVDSAPALVPVYVVHLLSAGATASQFLVQPGGGWNCTAVGEVVHIPVSIGSAMTGLSASYGGCLASDILIVTINFFCSGTSPTCAYIDVVPDPAAPTGTIEVVDCSFNKLIGVGWDLVANPDGSCDCGPPF